MQRMSGRRSLTPPTPPERESNLNSWLGIRPAPLVWGGGPRRLGDQSGAALPGEVGPEPLPLHHEPVLQLRQRHQMQEDPDEPGGEPARAKAPALQNHDIFAGDGHIALVEISERLFRFISLELAPDQAADIASLLDRRLRDAGHGSSVEYDR